MYKYIIKVCFLLICCFKVYGQETDLLAINLKEATMKNLLVNGQSLLYNGFNFYDYAPSYFENGNAFFLENSWLNGNVNYEGINYYQVPLKYDLIKDELIVQRYDKLSSINL